MGAGEVDAQELDVALVGVEYGLGEDAESCGVRAAVPDRAAPGGAAADELTADEVLVGGVGAVGGGAKRAVAADRVWWQRELMAHRRRAVSRCGSGRCKGR